MTVDMRPATPGIAASVEVGDGGRSLADAGCRLWVDLLPVLVEDDDRVYGAVLGGLDDVVQRRGVGVQHDGRVLLVEGEHGGHGVDAVAEPVAERAIDLDRHAVAAGNLRHGTGEGSGGYAAACAATSAMTSAASSSWRRRSATCIREMTRRCTWAVPSNSW